MELVARVIFQFYITFIKIVTLIVSSVKIILENVSNVRAVICKLIQLSPVNASKMYVRMENFFQALAKVIWCNLLLLKFVVGIAKLAKIMRQIAYLVIVKPTLYWIYKRINVFAELDTI